MKILTIYITGVLLISSFFSCKKAEVISIPGVERNTLNYVVRDNFGLSYLAVGLYSTGLERQLQETGPFTLLAPSDEAFKNAGFAQQADVSKNASLLTPRILYHIVSGGHSLKDQSLVLNKPLETIGGTKVFLSRVKKDVDTITTINGARVLRLDTKASNGIMQVIDRLLTPNLFEKVTDALSAESDLSLFYHGLKRSGLLDELKLAEEYTVFAPTNAAMKKSGYKDLYALETADRDELKKWLQYHIAKDRKFVQDYFLLAEDGSTSYKEMMQDGRELMITVRGQYNVPNSFSGISIRGLGNSAAIVPERTDIMAGNGVIHVLGTVLQ